MNKAQGAIEYLLILAASIVVVAVVITFMMGSLQSGKDVGVEQTYDYLCNIAHSDINACKCYRGDPGYDATACCTDAAINVPDDIRKYLQCS